MATTLARILLTIVVLVSLAPTAIADKILSSVSMTLCGIVGDIQIFVGILAIALFTLGGTLYAVGYFLPTTTEPRRNLQGWAAAMVIGAIIGLIVVAIAQPLVTLFANFAGTVGASAISNGCSGGGGSSGPPPPASCSDYCHDGCGPGCARACTWTCPAPGAACAPAGPPAAPAPQCTAGSPAGIAYAAGCPC